MLAVHGDEFYFLSRIYEYQRGELHEFFLTFHVHLFAWLTGVPGTEVDQILVARNVIFVLSTVSACLLYAIARTFFSIVASLCVVLAYLGIAEVIENSLSFRFDTLLLPLILFAIFIVRMARFNRWAELTCGAALALAIMISLKAVLFLPLVISVAAINGQHGRGRCIATILGSSVILLIALMAIHWSAVPTVASSDSLPGLENHYSEFISGTLLSRNFFYFLMSLKGAPISWTLILAGILFAARALRRSTATTNEIELFLCASCLLLPLIYRNAFPYFYVLLCAPLALLAGYCIEILYAASKKKGAFVLAFALIVLLIQFLHSWSLAWQSNDRELIAQARTLKTIHQLFPEPVKYLDAYSEVGSFSKVGFFMSTYWLEQYVGSGRPLLKEIVLREHPRFILANSECLDLSRSYEDAVTPAGYRLSRTDWEFLRENFVPYSDHIYLAK